MKIKSIIFDFDGTLFDSMGIWVEAGELYLRSVGKKAEKDLWKRLKSMSLLQSAAYLKETYALPFSIEEVIFGINKTVEDFYFYDAMPKDNIIPFLSELHDKGIKMCIATATDRYQVDAALTRCHMLPFFDAIFTCSEIGHGKDEPDIFEYALAYLQTEKTETAVFEDAYHAAKTAKEAGFPVVGIYDRYEKRTEEIKSFADFYMNDYSEYKEWMK